MFGGTKKIALYRSQFSSKKNYNNLQTRVIVTLFCDKVVNISEFFTQTILYIVEKYILIDKLLEISDTCVGGGVRLPAGGTVVTQSYLLFEKYSCLAIVLNVSIQVC